MSVLTNLLKCYEYCENEDLVDVHNGEDTVLLPLYHSNIKAAKNNILKVTLDENGDLLSADFAADGEVHFFPITEDSVARSSGIAPHPLEDKMQYCIAEIADADKFKAYMEEFNSFYKYVNNEEVKTFLTAIKHFLSNEQNYDKILSKLSLRDIKKAEKGEKGKGAGEIQYANEKGATVQHDFKNTFLSFTVKCQDNKYLKVNTFHELHNEFIRYTDETSIANGNQGICNISGNREAITYKHRGLMGNAKVVSVSNNKETYFGRLNEGSDIIKIGRKSSEKIHLMLKFLLENRNSNIHLAGALYLVNWFSGDIQNSIGFDISKTEFDDYMDDEMQTPVSEKNREIGRLFIKGSEKLNPSDKYYVMLVDKSSNGRISLKYYNEMQNSQLKENLEAWQDKYIWEKRQENSNSYSPWMPTLNSILLAAYGTERKGFLTIDKEGFKEAQFQNLVVVLIEGKSIPSNIKKTLAQNIRNRQRYNKTWNLVLMVSLAVLDEGRDGGKKEYKKMREKSDQTRSYLYGRLLAIYEESEKAVLRHKERRAEAKSSDESSGKSNIRSTNALRYWNAFANKPDTTLKTLELATKHCVSYMLSHDKLVGVLGKMEKAKSEIFELLDSDKNRTDKINAQLDSDFIFGYYAQRKELFTKKEENNE